MATALPIKKCLKKCILNSDVYAMCMQHALTTEKEEVMGLLVGEVDEDQQTSNIVTIIHLRRSDRKPDRVEISPEQLCLASSEAEKLAEKFNRPLRVMGWYHSHPHITAHPSHVDIKTQAMYEQMDPFFVGLIFSVFDTDSRTKTNKVTVTCFQSENIESTTPRKRAVPLEIRSCPIHAINLAGIANLPRILFEEEIESQERQANDQEKQDHLTELHNESLKTLSLVNIVHKVSEPMLDALNERLTTAKNRIRVLKELRAQLLKERAELLSDIGSELSSDTGSEYDEDEFQETKELKSNGKSEKTKGDQMESGETETMAGVHDLRNEEQFENKEKEAKEKMNWDQDEIKIIEELDMDKGELLINKGMKEEIITRKIETKPFKEIIQEIKIVKSTDLPTTVQKALKEVGRMLQKVTKISGTEEEKLTTAMEGAIIEKPDVKRKLNNEENIDREKLNNTESKKQKIMIEHEKDIKKREELEEAIIIKKEIARKPTEKEHNIETKEGIIGQADVEQDEEEHEIKIIKQPHQNTIIEEPVIEMLGAEKDLNHREEVGRKKIIKKETQVKFVDKVEQSKTIEEETEMKTLIAETVITKPGLNKKKMKEEKIIEETEIEAIEREVQYIEKEMCKIEIDEKGIHEKCPKMKISEQENGDTENSKTKISVQQERETVIENSDIDKEIDNQNEIIKEAATKMTQKQQESIIKEKRINDANIDANNEKKQEQVTAIEIYDTGKTHKIRISEKEQRKSVIEQDTWEEIKNEGLYEKEPDQIITTEQPIYVMEKQDREELIINEQKGQEEFESEKNNKLNITPKKKLDDMIEIQKPRKKMKYDDKKIFTKETDDEKIDLGKEVKVEEGVEKEAEIKTKEKDGEFKKEDVMLIGNLVQETETKTVEMEHETIIENSEEEMINEQSEPKSKN